MTKEPVSVEESNDAVQHQVELDVRGPDFFRIGLLLSTAYVLTLGAYAFMEWASVLGMEPNEFGDFLAGIFGPLALLWVVMGFLQQGQELRYSRDALLLQAKELRDSVAAQKDMGRAAWASVHVERDSIARAELERVRGQQPVLVMHTRGHMQSGGIVQAHFQLTNSGKDCFRVSLKLEGATFPLFPAKASQISSGKTHNFEIHIQAGQKSENCSALVEFRDIDGRASMRRYLISASGDAFDIEDEFGMDVAIDPAPIPR